MKLHPPRARSRLLMDFSLETTAKDAARFLQIRQLVPEGPQVNIAFLGSETFDQRLAAIETLGACGAHPTPIISARRLESLDVLESFLAQAVRIGRIQGIFLVGGDPSAPQGPFADSMDVINSDVLDKFEIATVSIAGYPEGHPRIRDEVLWNYLKRKVHALTSRGFKVEITTQLAFDAEAVMSWIEQVRRQGIHVPIRVGIPSPSTVSRLLKFARQCHVGGSMRLLRQHGWQLTSLLGSASPESFLISLRGGLEHRDLGDVRLHIFPLGDLPGTIQWLETSAGGPA